MATQSVNQVRRGTLQGLVRANGGWMAVISAFTSGPKDPVVSRIVPLEQLGVQQRKKADKWLEVLK